MKCGGYLRQYREMFLAQYLGVESRENIGGSCFWLSATHLTISGIIVAAVPIQNCPSTDSMAGGGEKPCLG